MLDFMLNLSLCKNMIYVMEVLFFKRQQGNNVPLKLGVGAKAVPYLERAIALDQRVSSLEPHELLAEHYKSTGDYL
jgi:hypothetical protein